MKYTMLENVVDVHINSESAKIAYIEGHAGIGKSNFPKMMCKKLNERYAKDGMKFTHVTIFGSVLKEGELGGIPIPVEDNEGNHINTYTLYWKIKQIQDLVAEGYHVILFIDELNRSELAVQQELMQLILDKVINTAELPIGDCSIIAAGNPEADDDNDYQVNTMNAALIDRFSFYNLTVDVEDWLAWAMDNGIHNDIVEFISSNIDMLHIPASTEKIKPTPRSWESVSKKYTTFIEEFNFDDGILSELVRSDIGRIPATAFMRHLETKTNPLIRVDEIFCGSRLSDNMVHRISGESIPRLTVTVKKLINYLDDGSKKNDKVDIENFITFCDNIPKDTMVSVIANIMHNHKNLHKKLSAVTEYLDLFYDTNKRLRSV